MKKVYPVFGIIAPISYILAVIIGGFLLKGYNHMYNSISELTASNVHKIPIIYILFLIYNVALILFGVGLYTDSKISFNIRSSIASLMLIFVGILGIAMLYFVQDPRNIPMTINGEIHLILAGISSVLTMVTIILLALSFKNQIRMKKFTIYSLTSFAIVFITGGITAVSVANNSPVGGLFERLTIGTFIVWIFVIAIMMFSRVNEYIPAGIDSNAK